MTNIEKKDNVIENNIKIKLKENMFFNPHMELCRDISSLGINAIGDKLNVCDGFTASGVRGIRYAVENDNVTDLTLLDADQRLKSVIKYNAKQNKIKANVVIDNFTKHIYDENYNFIELDPFGTPLQYFRPSISSLTSSIDTKTAYVSYTSTDPAVLCGAHRKACIKLYHSRPLHTNFCHEAGLRILLANLAWAAAEFDYSVEPLFTFSHRHYFKGFVKLTRGAKEAYNMIENKIGFVSFNNKTLGWECTKYPYKSGTSNEVGGPFWIDDYSNKDFLTKMINTNQERDYKNKTKINKFLGLLKGEVGLPMFYYDYHLLAQRYKIELIPMQDLLDEINKDHKAVKVHFAPTSFKTTAPLKTVVTKMKRISKKIKNKNKK